jgi:hypothetical protein
VLNMFTGCYTFLNFQIVVLGESVCKQVLGLLNDEMYYNRSGEYQGRLMPEFSLAEINIRSLRAI